MESRPCSNSPSPPAGPSLPSPDCRRKRLPPQPALLLAPHSSALSLPTPSAPLPIARPETSIAAAGQWQPLPRLHPVDDRWADDKGGERRHNCSWALNGERLVSDCAKLTTRQTERVLL